MSTILLISRINSLIRILFDTQRGWAYKNSVPVTMALYCYIPSPV